MILTSEGAMREEMIDTKLSQLHCGQETHFVTSGESHGPKLTVVLLRALRVAYHINNNEVFQLLLCLGAVEMAIYQSLESVSLLRVASRTTIARVAVYDGDADGGPVTSTPELDRRSMVDGVADVGYSSRPSPPANAQSWQRVLCA
ncbi:hypothetical protein OPT61_g2290 [Boeremia exigua]|uniref:Uncharacterized protein n=1 Tax=Boeremia exigua TaxID=749465 RepID=A0ACC2IMA9_9PLEO|nr:hypothetical protein OPT61_g2290 [Boeremia exigua]